MQEVFETEIRIVPSLADAQGRLAVPGVFSLFMDMAAEHARLLGLGFDDMKARDLFWLTVKTKIRIFRLPRMGEAVLLRTWPEKPGTLRCCRSYEMLGDGGLLCAGKTEWAVLNFAENRLVRIDGIYPEDLRIPDRTAVEEPFSRIPDDFDGIEPCAEYRVRSTDIDVGGHMNNAAYVRALAGSFSLDEWDSLPKSCVEVLFRAPCHEGDRILLQLRRTEGRAEIRGAREKETAILVRMEA